MARTSVKVEAQTEESAARKREGLEPRIAALVCTYCTYTAADLAGSMRLSYPVNVRVIQYLCTGKVDLLHILKAFEAGADVVFVSGCEIGDCHFMEGNLRAKERVAFAKHLLEEVGLEPERLEMFHIGASEAGKWAETVREMTARARALGPNPLRAKLWERADDRGTAQAPGRD